MSEGRGVALAILGIVALIAVVGLILLFSGKLTGKIITQEMYGGYGADKLYGGWANAQVNSPKGPVVGQEAMSGGGASNPYQGNWVIGVPYTTEGIPVAVIGGNEATYRIESSKTACSIGLARMGAVQMRSLSDEAFAGCIAGNFNDGSMCCPITRLAVR